MWDLETIFNPVSQKLLIAAGLGMFIGLERELSGKDPGLRTFSLISLGSCVFSIISAYAASDSAHPNADPGRIAAQIVSGVGFLGAGAIFRSPRGVSGLTTAALMWITAAIGMAVGFDRTDIAIEATIIALLIMTTLRLAHKFLDKRRSRTTTSKI